MSHVSHLSLNSRFASKWNTSKLLTLNYVQISHQLPFLLLSICCKRPKFTLTKPEPPEKHHRTMLSPECKHDTATPQTGPGQHAVKSKHEIVWAWKISWLLAVSLCLCFQESRNPRMKKHENQIVRDPLGWEIDPFWRFSDCLCHKLGKAGCLLRLHGFSNFPPSCGNMFYLDEDNLSRNWSSSGPPLCRGGFSVCYSHGISPGSGSCELWCNYCNWPFLSFDMKLSWLVTVMWVSWGDFDPLLCFICRKSSEI